MSASDDQAAAERVLAGEVEAFELIVHRWQRPLVNLAYRFCRDRGRAEDMAQEAFLHAFRAIGRRRKRRRVFDLAVLPSPQIYRSELKRIPARTVSLDHLAALRDSRPVDGGLEQEGRDRTVRQAVLTLPPRYRDPLTPLYFHSLDVAA